MVQPGKILITGGAGFVGTSLCRYLHDKGCSLRVLIRRGGSRLPEDLARDLDDVVEIDDLANIAMLPKLLDGVEKVVHLAARAHTKDHLSSADLYFQENLDVTVALAQMVLAAQVKKFIFLSTVKVNGEGVLKADHNPPYRSSDKPRPQGAYAVSKWRAEQKLRALFNDSETSELVILRPPLVYAETAKANYALLRRWLRFGLPLPVSRVGNQRSILSLERLVTVISLVLVDNVKIPETLLLLCDHKVWSTESLARMIAESANCKLRTLRIPLLLLEFVAVLFWQRSLFIKLFGSLRVEHCDCFDNVI